MEYTRNQSPRGSMPAMPTAYDEKDDYNALKNQLARRKKPIYIGLAFLGLVIVGVCIGVASSKTSEANNKAGEGQAYQYGDTTPSPASSTSAPSSHGSGSRSASSKNSDDSVAGESQLDSGSSSNHSSSSSSTPFPSPTGPVLPYSAVSFDWADVSNWEYSSGKVPGADMFNGKEIKLTSGNSPEPIRTKKGWGGEKVVFIEWERSDSSDTNIWMLNTKIKEQFAPNNGWPHLGELDLFEMFTQDRVDKPAYDFSGFQTFTDVASYGQLTMHMGARKEEGERCFCPASPVKSAWYQNKPSMTSGCTAQFANLPKNSIAAVFGRDGTGQFIQLLQNPQVTKGGKKGEQDTYDIQPGGAASDKIYNNAQLFWGVPASEACAAAGGHNAQTGFPFFDEFRLIFEEQKKNDASAWFKVTNVQIFTKN